jgi:ATP dependent DNA ligase C terminal region
MRPERVEPARTTGNQCPRCGGVLKFPESIGACTSCGYCHQIPNFSMPSAQSPADELLEGDTAPPVGRTRTWMVGAAVVGVLVAAGLIYSFPALIGRLAPSKPAASADRDPVVDSDHSIPILKPKDDDDSRPKLTCTVVGYVPDEEGGLSGLVLATRDDKDRLRFAGVVQVGVSGWQSKSARDRLSGLAIKRPVIEGPVDLQAVWIRPVITCIVHHSGKTASGLLTDPTLAELRANPNDG